MPFIAKQEIVTKSGVRSMHASSVANEKGINKIACSPSESNGVKKIGAGHVYLSVSTNGTLKRGVLVPHIFR